MKRSRFTEEQIIAILREQEAGVTVSELCRKHGLSSRTFYKWKAKFGGMDISEARKLKALEEESGRLKRMGRSDRRRLALHRAGKAAAERPQRELQRPPSGLERDPVPLAPACPSHAPNLAARLQPGPTSLETRLAHPRGVQRPLRAPRRERCATHGLRAPGSCHPSTTRLRSPPDSRYG